MKLFLEIIIVITAIVLTVSILFQSGNSAGLSGSIGGGAEQLFGKKKSRGYETILSRITTVCAVIFFISAIAATALPDGSTAAITADDITIEGEASESGDAESGAVADGTAEDSESGINADDTAKDSENGAADSESGSENDTEDSASGGESSAE